MTNDKLSDDISVSLPIQDWALVIGCLIIFHKYEKYNSRVDNLVDRMNYYILRGLKEQGDKQ